MQDREVDQPALRESAPGLEAVVVNLQPRWDSAFGQGAGASTGRPGGCLLYTSDAADDPEIV